MQNPLNAQLKDRHYRLARLLSRVNYLLFPLGLLGALHLVSGAPNYITYYGRWGGIIGLGCLLWWGYHHILKHPSTLLAPWIWFGTLLYNLGLLFLLGSMLMPGAWFIVSWQVVVCFFALRGLWLSKRLGSS